MTQAVEQPTRNRLAGTLFCAVEHSCLEVIGHETDGDCYDMSSSGLTHDLNSDDSRSATNEECSAFAFETRLVASFDRRERIPHQVAKWLRKMAKRFAKAAAEVELLEDTRDLVTFRRLVRDPSYLEALESKGMTIDGEGHLCRADQI